MPLTATLDPTVAAQLVAVAAELHETAAQLAAQLAAAQRRQNAAAPTLHGRPLYGAQALQLDGGDAATSQTVSNSPGTLAGYSLRETSGTTSAVVRLRDGIDTGGQLLATISLAPAESARDWFMPQGIGFANGLYVEVVTGPVEGVCWLGAAR